ncbi:MAG: peptide ABC transporter substrate-binding protein [Rectinemataceae bacterium]
MLAAQEASRTEFVTVFNAARPELDPHRAIYSNEAQVFTALYEGLFSYDPSSLEPVRAAVASWSRSKDGLVYDFDLRQEARWSDGSPLLASDFRDSWLRILSMNADYAAFFDIISGARDYRGGKTSDASKVGIKALSDKRLEVTLEAPAAYFTRLLCHHSFAPIHPSMLEAEDWSASLPFPVNGPYRFASGTQEASSGDMVLEKNPEYWDAASVAISTLRLVFTDDDTVASAMFDGGQADWLAGPGDLDVLLRQDAIQINPMFATHYWFFDSATGPWKDARIRRALALLLPWDELRNTEQYLIPASTLVLPMPGYSDVKGIETENRPEALGLLAEAGYPEGSGLPAVRIAFVDGKDARRVTGLMKKAWESLPGLKVELVVMPASRYYDQIGKGPEKGNFTLAHTTWIGDFADPVAFLQMWTTGSSLNDADFSNPKYDTLLAGSQAKEGKERFALLAEAENILLQDAVVLPFYHGFAVSVIDAEYIQGWYQNALDIHPYKAFRFGTPTIRPNVAESSSGARYVSLRTGATTEAPR